MLNIADKKGNVKLVFSRVITIVGCLFICNVLFFFPSDSYALGSRSISGFCPVDAGCNNKDCSVEIYVSGVSYTTGVEIFSNSSARRAVVISGGGSTVLFMPVEVKGTGFVVFSSVSDNILDNFTMGFVTTGGTLNCFQFPDKVEYSILGIAGIVVGIFIIGALGKVMLS